MTDNEPNPLLGTWVSDPTEPAVWKRFARVTLEFFPNGTLRHKFEQKDGGPVEFKRSYSIEKKNILVQKAPRLHDSRNKFEITPEGKLVLYENRRRYPYVRKT